MMSADASCAVILRVPCAEVMRFTISASDVVWFDLGVLSFRVNYGALITYVGGVNH